VLACFRRSRDADIVGTFQANPKWGTSTLVIRSDHTFEQTVSTSSGSFRRVEGRWELHTSTSGDSITFDQKYLSATHDEQGEEVDGAFASVNRGLFGGVEISADPDYGIAFRKVN
jgi:hypothetical protein